MNEKNKSRFRWFVYKKTETPFTRAKNSVRHAKVLAPCLNHFGTALPIYMTQSKRFFSSWAWFQFLIGTPSLSLFYFSFFKFTRGTVFPFLKVVSCSLRFWTAISCSLFNFTEHIKYDFFSCWWKFLNVICSWTFVSLPEDRKMEDEFVSSAH